MTDEKRAEELNTRLLMRAGNPYKLILATFHAARDAEREACCKALCPHCADGLPIELRESTYRHNFDGAWFLCRAAAIRERVGQSIKQE